MNKKRIWLVLPAALIPYVSLGAVAFFWLLAPFIYAYIPWEHMRQYFIFYYIGLILAFCLLAMVLSILCFVKSTRSKWDAQSLAKTAMIIKLIQIPAYVAIYVMGILMAISLFTIPFAFALFLLDCLALALTGLLNLSAVIEACREGKTTVKKSWWVIVLQAVFCADVVASVIFFRMLKKQDQETAA